MCTIMYIGQTFNPFVIINFTALITQLVDIELNLPNASPFTVLTKIPNLACRETLFLDGTLYLMRGRFRNSRCRACRRGCACRRGILSRCWRSTCRFFYRTRVSFSIWAFFYMSPRGWFCFSLKITPKKAKNSRMMLLFWVSSGCGSRLLLVA